MENKTKWSIDQANSEITFKVGHIIISNVKGSFKTFDANIYANLNDFATTEVDLWIDCSSINTGDKNRDNHLKGEDFFDVNNHRQITFNSNAIGKSDKEGNHELFGDLTIRGITKVVKLNAKIREIKNSWGENERAVFTISGKLNRSDWGLYGKSSFEAGGMMVSKEVKMMGNIQLISALAKGGGTVTRVVYPQKNITM